jgi:hypothetical protein
VRNLHLTNYKQKKSRNKPTVSAGRRDLRVSAELAGHRVTKNRNFILKHFIRSIFRKYYYLKITFFKFKYSIFRKINFFN